MLAKNNIKQKINHVKITLNKAFGKSQPLDTPCHGIKTPPQKSLNLMA